MGKLFFSTGAIAIAVTAVFVWSHTVLTPLHASPASSVNPTDMSYKGPLPVEQQDAI